MAKRASKPNSEDSEYERLVALVAANPRAWLGCGELAIYFRLPPEYITAASTDKDTPFIGKNCNPDLLDAWLRSHPGLTLK